MNDKDFITYLGVKLLNSGEDCCSICANNPQTGICENSLRKKPNDRICIEGLRKFAEQAMVKKSKEQSCDSTGNQYEKEYFIGIIMLQSDLEVLRSALQAVPDNKEKAETLLSIIESQETAQKKWDDDDPKTEELKTIGMSVNLAFRRK